MSSAGTAAPYALSATAPRSRAMGNMPISFSTCTMSTVVSRESALPRCSMNAANARASASSVFFENAERISTLVPSATFTCGNRAESSFTHEGT